MRPAETFLPDPLTVLHWLVDQSQGFGTRPDYGIKLGLIDRMLRQYQGDPCGYQTATSTYRGNQSGIPRVDEATSCIIYVAGNDIYYRVDGESPNPNGDQTIQEGSTVTLTGQPSMTAFQFIATSVETATLYITYYT